MIILSIIDSILPRPEKGRQEKAGLPTPPLVNQPSLTFLLVIIHLIMLLEEQEDRAEFSCRINGKTRMGMNET